MSKLSSDRLADPRTAGHHTNTVKTESSADDYQSTAPPTTPASQVCLIVMLRPYAVYKKCFNTANMYKVLYKQKW